MKPLIRFAKVARTAPVVSKALKVSVVVGSLLNLINQGDVLVPFDLEHLNVFKLVLTYIIPYGVTTYTAVSLKLEFTIGRHAIIETDLECQTCHTPVHVHVKEHQLIPECDTCGINTYWKAI